MSSLLNLCERYFGTHNFYDVLKIPKSADDKQVKKAYYKQALLVHPDRVEDNIKAEATEKFKILAGIYSVLSDNERRKVYDKSIQYDEKSEDIVLRKLVEYISLLEKIITVKNINGREKMRLSVPVSLCALLRKRRGYDESRQKEIIIRNLTDYLLFLLEEISTVKDINNCEKR
ncbi:J domain-containing protein [Formica fusca]